MTRTMKKQYHGIGRLLSKDIAMLNAILLIVIVRGEKTKTKRPIGTARRRSKAMPWPSIIWDGLIIMVGESPKIIPKLRCGCRKPQSRDIAARSNFLRNSTRKERASGKILRRL